MQMPPGSAKPSSRAATLTAVAKDVVGFDDDVAEVDPHSEANEFVFGRICVAVDHPALDLDGTANRIHHAAELGEHAVTGILYDAPAMLFDLRFD
jgi:hypothetical protein